MIPSWRVGPVVARSIEDREDPGSNPIGEFLWAQEMNLRELV